MKTIAHQLFIRDPFGNLTTVIPDSGLLALAYGLKENEASVLEFTLPISFDQNLIGFDYIVEVYRRFGAAASSLEGDTAFFIRRIIIGEYTISITAYSACSLLGRRIVAYFAGTSYSDKTYLPWDDLMKEYVDQNFGPGASYAPSYYGGDPARNLEPWFTVTPDISYGALYSKSAPWRNVLEVLQDIVNDVRSAGIICSFDVICTGPARFEFRVYIGPRGIDHSSTSDDPVIVSKDMKNLSTSVLDESWEAERNYIYGTGQGLEENRITAIAFDADRIGIGPFNRQEYNRDARQGGTGTYVQAEANAALQELRPRRIFTGSIIQTRKCIYGIHWKWGDIVTAVVANTPIDCYVNAVVVTVDTKTGTETVEGNLRSVTDV